MNHNEKRPGGGHRGAAIDRGRSGANGTSPDRDERSADPGRLDDDPAFLRVAFRAVDRLVRAAHRLYGPLPVVDSPEWYAAPWIAQAATMAVLGERYVVRDPDRIAADQLKAASVAIATGADWTAASRRPSHASLAAIRAELGPLARPFDPVAARRWAATGDSQGGAA